MGLFNRTKKDIVSHETRYKLVTETGNGIYCWNGKVYDSDIVRACINAKARATGKLVAKHIRSGHVNPEPYMRMLLDEPNPIMSGQQFQEKMCRMLCINNNAFALVNRDANGYPIALYPVAATNAEAVYDDTGSLYIKFYMANGKQYTFDYADIIHLRQDYNENDVFGSPIMPSLAPLMEVTTATDQSIVNAVKNSAVIKWLLKYSTALRPDDLKKQASEFASSFLDTQNGTGVAAVDSKVSEAKQIENSDYVPNASQMDKTKQRIYSLFGVSEKIVQSSYTEDEWNAFYESQIEPVAIDMANELTRKLFTRKERGFGNRIVFEAANLQYASMSTKLNLMQMVDRGALTPNEWRNILNMAPIDGGDEPIRRLDTAVVQG